MDAAKRKRLEAMGWRIGSAEDFLGLTASESAYIEIKLKLGKNLKQKRLEKNLTQRELAQALKSDQSRIAKMEAGDPSVSIDLLIRSLFTLGTSHKELATIISGIGQIS